MTRAEIKERNRRALLDAAHRVVAKDGHAARLDEIAAQAELTTGAVYSLFGSKSDLLVELVAEYLGPEYEAIERSVPPELDLVGAVEAFARYYRRQCADPDARHRLSFELSVQDMALRDPGLRTPLAVSVREQEEHLVGLFTGRSHGEVPVTRAQAQRLATALRALLIGLSEGVILGLTEAPEQYFVETACALITPEVLGAP